ncbi:MAG: DUF748 domain-containing protein [Deltaproteobacteria bacterium]|nr:DUF748 domain-containing protein [Deltaproteobacteria bacterium]
MSRHSKKFWLWILIPVVVVGIFLFWTIHYLFDPDLYRNAIQRTLSSQLGREVSFGKAKIGFWGGIGIAFEDFRIKDHSQSFDLLYSPRLILTAKTLPLLKREVKWKRITFQKPVGRFSRDRNGKFNFSGAPLNGEALKSSQSLRLETEQKMIETLSTLFGGSLSIRSGQFSFSDEFLDGPPILTEIQSLELRLSEISFDKPFPFQVSGKIIHSKKEGKFSISGTIEDIPEGMDFSKGKVNVEVEAKGIEVFHFWPYLKPLVPMNKIAGILDLKGKYQGDLSGPFSASLKIHLKEVTYDHPKVFAYLFTPKWVNLDLQAKYDRQTFEIPKCSVELPEIKVNAKGRIYGIGTEGMGLDAEASSNVFDIADGRRFIPFRIITPSVSDPLFRAEGSGPAQILSVKLSGKIPEIDHCDELYNAHVLSVEMKVNHARLKLPWNLPALEELKGHLLFKQGHLHLKEMEARVFHSSIDRANGTFYELLQVPTLEIQGHGQFQVADLSSLLKTDILADDTEIVKAFEPITSLSGKATYQLSVKGRLKSPLRFLHQGEYLLSKVHLTHAQVPFPISIGEGKISLSNEIIQWSGAKVEFGNSSLLLAGSSKKGGASEITAKGKVDLKNILTLNQSSLFPKETQWKTEEIKSLSGACQITFKGKQTTSLQPLSYELELLPRDASLLLKNVSHPLLFRDGSVSISNLGAAFSKFKIQSLNSFLILDGTMKHGALQLSTSGSIDLKNIYALLQLPLFPDSMRTQMDDVQDPTGGLELHLHWSGRMDQGMNAIREGEMLLKDISFRHRKIPVPLSQIEGKIRFSPQQMQWDGLKAKIGDSSLTLSGTSPRSQTGIGERQLSLNLTSTHLDLDTFFPPREKTTPASYDKIREWLSLWSIQGKINVEKGRYRNFDFKDLKFELKTADGKLIIHPFQLKANGGDLWGEGWLESAEKGIRFQIKPRLSHMEATAFLRTLLKKEDEEKVLVTGRVYIDQVQLRGEGENFQKLKESLEGGIRLELENGVIERGNILAKIFSILNVSQLFKGRVPDLKTKGLPYQRISGTFQIKEGIASTEDFLIDSDAMRITAVGKVDLGKNLIDTKVGVHPLGTVDTILSSIPIAGYILTGKEKAFLSYVYEVKGDLGDPKIEAIPFKAVGEGLFGIFKRLLETPLRPFQRNNSRQEKGPDQK